MNQAVDLIDQGQVDKELLFFFELSQFEMVDEFEILFFFLLESTVGVGEHTDTEEQVKKMSAFGHVFFNVLDTLLEKF